jgi:hypothetical protein
VTDVDEAATGISLDRVVLLPTGGRVGVVTVTDPDAADGNGTNYTASNITVGGTDGALFTVAEVNGDAVLSFASGTPAETSYDIMLTASDPDDGTLTHSEAFTIQVGGVKVGGQGTGYVDGSGDGLLAENAVGSTTKIEIGALSHELTSQVNFELAAADSGNNNADFEITGGKLYYTGGDSGDFEAGDTLTVEITSDNASDSNPITESYIIHLANVDDLPVFDTPPPPVGALPFYSFTLAENADGSTTAVTVGTVSATDLDGDSITYSLAAGLEDNNKFEINATTGEVTAKTGEISAYANGDSYKIVVLASNSKDDRPDTAAEVAEMTDQSYVFLHGLILARKDGASIDGVELAPEDMDIEFFARTTETLKTPALTMAYDQIRKLTVIASKAAKDHDATLEEIYEVVEDTSRHVANHRLEVRNLVEVRYATDAAGNEIGDRNHIITFSGQDEAFLFQDYEVITIDVV